MSALTDMIATELAEFHDGRLPTLDDQDDAQTIWAAILSNPDTLLSALIEAGVLVQPITTKMARLGSATVPIEVQARLTPDGPYWSDMTNFAPLYLWAPETGETPDHE